MRGLAVILLAGIALGSGCAQAQQAAVYGNFSASKMQNLLTDNVLYGGSAGVLLDREGRTYKHFQLGGDIEGRFLHASNFDFDAAVLGPRIYVPIHHVRPYGEFMAGFARINHAGDPPAAPSSTDFTIELNGGVMKKITPHIDVDAEYSYQQFYAFGGEYNPKTFSVGVAYYFEKR